MLALIALLTTVLPTAPVWAAECTTKDAKVSYSVAYDNLAKADVVTSVNVSRLPIECAGQTLAIVLSKAAVSTDQFDVPVPAYWGVDILVFKLWESIYGHTEQPRNILASNVDAVDVYVSTVKL